MTFMRHPNLQYSKLILICVNEREGKECCANAHAEELYYALKTQCAAIDPSIRVSKTGCLGNCLSGPIVVIQPDNIWLGEVKESDIPEIIKLVESSL